MLYSSYVVNGWTSEFSPTPPPPPYSFSIHPHLHFGSLLDYFWIEIEFRIDFFLRLVACVMLR